MRQHDEQDLLLAAVISCERSLHPGMQLQDLHKLLFQASLGADHMLDLPGRILEAALAREWSAADGTGARPGPPLQIISPSARVARLHFAPLKRLGIPFETVSEAVLGQERLGGSMDDLRGLVERAAVLSERGLVPFPAADIRALPLCGSPPHHSPSYGPACYRVVNDAAGAAHLLPGVSPFPPAG